MFRLSQLTKLRMVSRPINTFIRMNSVNHKLNTESVAYKYFKEGPKLVKFTNEHEWLAIHNDDTAFLGITKYASEALGDATYIELPEVGDRFEVGEAIGSVESVKSASEIYLPVKGEVVAVNDELEGSPQLINEDPMGEGWMIQVKLADPSLEGTNLLTEEEYESTLVDH